MSIDIHSSCLTSKAFVASFKIYHGRTPNGEKCHYCQEWDYLPIDSACKEFEACLCFSTEVENEPK